MQYHLACLEVASEILEWVDTGNETDNLRRLIYDTFVLNVTEENLQMMTKRFNKSLEKSEVRREG